MTDYARTNDGRPGETDCETTNSIDQTWNCIVDSYDNLMRRLAEGPGERSEAP